MIILEVERVFGRGISLELLLFMSLPVFPVPSLFVSSPSEPRETGLPLSLLSSILLGESVPHVCNFSLQKHLVKSCSYNVSVGAIEN